MELLNDIVINIFFNIYSYAVYIIGGILLYEIINIMILKLKLDEGNAKIIIVLISMFIPICSCISITFLLYKKIIDDEKFILMVYVLSAFFNISAFLLIYLYFGHFILYMYFFTLVLTLILINTVYEILDKKIENKNNLINSIDLNNNRIDHYKNKLTCDNKFSVSEELKYVSNFVFIHYSGIAIMSFIYALFKSVQYLGIAIDSNNVILFLLNNIILKYMCIPNDVVKIAPMAYAGYRVSFIISVIVISFILNIPELLLLLTRIRNRFMIFVIVMLPSVFIGLLLFIFDNNDAMNKISINYDDKLFMLANNLNINPNGLVRDASIIIYILLFMYFISQKKGELKL